MTKKVVFVHVNITFIFKIWGTCVLHATCFVARFNFRNVMAFLKANVSAA